MTTLEKVRERAESDAKTHGYYLTPDKEILQDLLEGLQKNEERYGSILSMPISQRKNRVRQRHNLPMRLPGPRRRRTRILLLHIIRQKRRARTENSYKTHPRAKTRGKTDENLHEFT